MRCGIFSDLYKINLKIRHRSLLTRLFVYKVLNQEVLDDRGKFLKFDSEKKESFEKEKLKTRFLKIFLLLE